MWSVSVWFDILFYSFACTYLSVQTSVDDCSYGPIPFTGGSFSFFGASFASIYVNSNGILSFGSANTAYAATAFPITGKNIIAVFWTDVQTTGSVASIPGYPLPNNIYYRFTTPLAADVARMTAEVASAFPSEPLFTPTILAVITYFAIGRYSTLTDFLDTFQAVLASDGVGRSFVTLCFDNLTWQSPSNAATSFPNVGFNSGTGGRFFNVPMSFSSAARNLTCYGLNGW
jgi:alpha-tectorin